MGGLKTLKFGSYWAVVGIFCSVALMPLPSLAQITANRTVVHWRANQPPVLNTTVRNGGDFTLLVETEAYKVEAPGTPEESRVPTEDLIVTPKKAAISGGHERIVRLLYKGKRTNIEQVYRVTLAPRDAEHPDESDEDSERTGRSGSVRLRVLTGVGMLIFIEPLNPNPELTWERTGRSIRFQNKGNVNVLVTLIKVCPRNSNDQEKQCTTLPGKRLYPGGQIEFDVDPNSVFKFRKRFGEETVDLEIP